MSVAPMMKLNSWRSFLSPSLSTGFCYPLDDGSLVQFNWSGKYRSSAHSARRNVFELDAEHLRSRFLLDMSRSSEFDSHIIVTSCWLGQ